jgi:hypothetical protein
MSSAASATADGRSVSRYTRERQGRQGPRRPRDTLRRTRTRHRRRRAYRTPRLEDEVEGVLSVPADPTGRSRLVGPAGEDSAEPGAMIADGCPQAALEHLGGPRRRPPQPNAAGTHGHRPPPRDQRPPSQKLTDVAEELGLSHVRVRQLQRRAEDALRAETPVNLALAACGLALHRQPSVISGIFQFLLSN